MRLPTWICLMLCVIAPSVKADSCGWPPPEPTNSIAKSNSPSMRQRPTKSLSLTGWATYYDQQSCQKEHWGTNQPIMANGQPLDDNAMTCALWIVGKHGRPLCPDGQLVTVRNVQTGSTIVTAWQDNGPGRVPRSKGVIIDLTPAVFKKLARLEKGRIRVRVERVK